MPPRFRLRDWYESDKSNHPDNRSLLFISSPRKLHFTLNHYTMMDRLFTFKLLGLRRHLDAVSIIRPDHLDPPLAAVGID
ncbi:hypothetical protein BH23PLA1_BH23PLA1_36110 [soil metagenome]